MIESIEYAEKIVDVAYYNFPLVYPKETVLKCIDALIIEYEKQKNEWISIHKQTPITYETGTWDGLRSGFVLVECRDEKYHVCKAYEGTLDGNHFLEFWDDRDFQVNNIIRWKYIN